MSFLEYRYVSHMTNPCGNGTIPSLVIFKGLCGKNVTKDNYLYIPKLEPTGHMPATLRSFSAMLTWATVSKVP